MPPKIEFQNSVINHLEKSVDFYFEKTPTFKINLHGHWDTASRNDLFISQLKKLSFYKEGLLYSGFNAKHPKKVTDTIFCAEENDLANTSSEGVNPINYAGPTIGVYDPSKMEEAGSHYYEYRILSPDALIALINIYEENESGDEEAEGDEGF